MKSFSSEQLRELRTKFRESKAHKYLPEASLIGGKESTAMFTIAGMQQLIPYLSGKEHPLGGRLFNIQKCVRTVDIDEVGDASHLTCFEMMGNRSLGTYFKKESVERSWEFLTSENYLGMDPKKIAVTVFEGDEGTPKDEETAEYRKALGMPEDRIVYLPADNNRRSPGPVGPCGPDTEIFYRVGESELPPAGSNPKTDEKNWMEVWNNVFMEFYRDEKGLLTKLKNQNVDTGMGFERMCKVVQNKASVYDTDVFQPILSLLEKVLEVSYADHARRLRVITDHSRTAFFLIKDGITPSNEGRGYVLRRLIRRMYYNFILLKEVPEQKLKESIQAICEWIAGYIHFQDQTEIDRIVTVLLKEMMQFQKTINNGQKLIKDLIETSKNKTLAGKDIFMLYDTFGFPVELTKEIAEEKGLKLDMDGFDKEMEGQQERSRQGSKLGKINIDRARQVAGIPKTQFVGYETLQTTQPKLLKDVTIEGQRVLIFDATPFYAESGGQTGDRGNIELESGENVEIIDVKKYEGVFLHFVK